MRSIDSVWTWILLEEEFMAYDLCNSPKMGPPPYGPPILESCSMRQGNAAEISRRVGRISSIE
jgi:hypothetical protein